MKRNKWSRRDHRWLTWIVVGALILGGIATAVQAQEPVNVTFNGVDASEFPKVVTYVTVSDATGHAVFDLPPEAFSVMEDGKPIKGLTVEPLENVGEPILMVLVFDTSGSMEGRALSDTQTAAIQLISSLGPSDQIAVLSFDTEVTTRLDFTADKDAAVTAVEAFEAVGGTAFNDAVFQAVQMLASRPRGRKALVVLTDGDDTDSVLTIEDAIDAAQDASVPVYATGFGASIRPDVLERLATLTGGHFYRSPSSEEVDASFKAVADLLRYQYVLRFNSSLLADDAAHTLRATVDVGDVQASNEEDLLAIARDVAVAMRSPSDGDTVGGMVTLKPRIDAPGEVAQVAYLLDGAPLATVTTGEFAYEWDATAVPLGEHALAVRVTDSAGNQGQTEINLTVAEPIEVLIVTPTGTRPVGADTPVGAEVDALAGVAKIEFAVDDVVVATLENAPWDFNWDTTALTTGPHTLTATAFDIAGQSAEDSVDLWVGLDIEMPDLSDLDLAGGLMALAPEIVAPANIAQVEYLLDGNLLATTTGGDFAYEWDARAAELGAHQLTVRVTDADGNTGQLDRALTVVEPIVVTFISPPEEQLEQLSGEVTVEAEVVTVAGVERVEFAIDGAVIQTVTDPPYGFVWDTTAGTTGRHILTATAYDTKGLSELDSLEVWTAFRGSSWGVWVALVVLLLGAGVIVPLGLRKRRRVAAQPTGRAAPVASGLPEGARLTTTKVGHPVAWLTVERGPETGQRWPITPGDTSLGRRKASNDIVVPSRTASREHAVIRADATRCTYYDLGTTNPSLINDAPLVGSHVLVQGDRIRIGDVILRFSKEDQP